MTRAILQGKHAARVAHILPFPAVGGTEIAQLRAARVVAGAGGVNLILHRPGATSVRDLFREHGFETAVYPPLELALRSPAGFLRESRAFARELAGLDLDLVHCADILAAMHAGLAGRLAGLPVLSHVRNRYAELTWRQRQLLRPVHKFAFVSRDTWRHFAHHVPERRGAVVYDGYDPPANATAGRTERASRAHVREEFNIPPDAPIIGMVARVAPQKDYPTLIGAARRVARRFPDAWFVVVGDHSTNPQNREHFAMVSRLLDEEGVRARFVFTDFRSDVPRFLEAMDVFVLSTHWEGFPLVLLEAMAYGRPVVATAVDGVPEIVADGENGFLVPHEDEEALADRLVRLLGDRSMIVRMGAAARDRVRNGFSLAEYGRQLLGVYAELLDRHAPEGGWGGDGRGARGQAGSPLATAGAHPRSGMESREDGA